MSVQAITAAFAIQGVSPSEKLTLLALANYADQDGRCWPSQVTLTHDTGLSERTVWAAMQRLEAAGLISRERRRRSDGYRTSDLVTLTLPATIADRENLTRKSREPYPQILQTLPATVAGQEPSGEPSEEPLEIDQACANDPFEAFWSAYPRKIGKPKARAAYVSALRRCTGPPAILNGLLRWVPVWIDPKFTPHPTTWLNRDGWNDIPESHERPNHHPTTAADRRRADTDNRRNAWADVIAERAGVVADPEPERGPGGDEGNGVGYLRLAHAATG